MSAQSAARRPRTAGAGAPGLGALLAGIAVAGARFERPIGRLRLHSAEVETGDVFIALPGAAADGRDYIAEAVARGAAAVLYEAAGTDRQTGLQDGAALLGIAGLRQRLGELAARHCGRPSRRLRVIGITGTNGKTTVACLLAQALDRLGGRCGYIGTVGAGFSGRLAAAERTTLDAISAQVRLKTLLDEGATHVAMEVSSHGLDQGRVNGIDFKAAVFTNLSQDHLDYHGSMSSYAQAKRKLFEFASLEQAVLNVDDPFGRSLVEFCAARGLAHLTFGAGGALAPSALQLDLGGIRLTLGYRGKTRRIQSKLLGMINVPNLLAVVGALLALGRDWDDIAEVMPELEPPPGRMEVFGRERDGPAVVVDYAHTPEALARALDSLRALCRGRLFVVFGCGGDRDRDKRPQMGRTAQRRAEVCIVTDDNPRSEPPAQIVEHILQGMSGKPQVIHDRVAAVRAAIGQAGPGDVILLAGKGHETCQDIGGARRQLSDRACVPALLAETGTA